MSVERPVLISVMQFEDALKSGAMTVFDVIDAAAATGADGVELRRELWTGWESELGQARQHAEAKGLLITYATHATLFSTDAATLRGDIDAAASLGSPIVRFFPGQLPADDDATAWAGGQAIADYAAEKGVVIALENYARIPGGTLAEVQTCLARIPSLMTNFDMGNYSLHGQDIPAAAAALANRIVSSHLKDQTGNPSDPPTVLGAGVLPLDAIFDALDSLPQRVIYCFEFRGGDDAVARIEQSLDYLKKRWS
ncbi:MAG: sugar phosphate isomerase/epimerase [Caldilineaceae bacterium]|nr:sugar phosphate isomerase/epimerase [Caldilineaceae bacterium]